MENEEVIEQVVPETSDDAAVSPEVVEEVKEVEVTESTTTE